MRTDGSSVRSPGRGGAAAAAGRIARASALWAAAVLSGCAAAPASSTTAERASSSENASARTETAATGGASSTTNGEPSSGGETHAAAGAPAEISDDAAGGSSEPGGASEPDGPRDAAPSGGPRCPAPECLRNVTELVPSWDLDHALGLPDIDNCPLSEPDCRVEFAQAAGIPPARVHRFCRSVGMDDCVLDWTFQLLEIVPAAPGACARARFEVTLSGMGGSAVPPFVRESEFTDPDAELIDMDPASCRLEDNEG